MGFPTHSQFQGTSYILPVSAAAGITPTWMQPAYGPMPAGIVDPLYTEFEAIDNLYDHISTSAMS